jgi:hypothetical protein
MQTLEIPADTVVFKLGRKNPKAFARRPYPQERFSSRMAGTKVDSACKMVADGPIWIWILSEQNLWIRVFSAK